MNWLGLLMLPSIIAILSLPWIKNREIAARWSFILTVVSFLIALRLIILVYSVGHAVLYANQWFMCDTFGSFYVLLNTFITMTTAFYAMGYLKNEYDRSQFHPLTYRFYHTFYHLFTFSMLLVLISNNLGVMWIAMELATISSVVLVALYQTTEALEAAWKYLILCGVGLGLALLGTIIFYFASHHSLVSYQGLQWTALLKIASQLPPKLLEISFVFIFVGYGTKAGFFPLHSWLPDAHAEGPTPISALLSGLLLNVALFAIIRFKLILDQTAAHHFAQILLILFGFMNLLYAAFSLLRQHNIKRLFAYSSIEHMGLISIAFGIGTPLAYLAGLFHVLLHALSKTAAFFTAGNLIQVFHTQVIKRLRAAGVMTPLLAWLLLLSSLALLGLPPFGLFISEMLLLFAVVQVNYWLVIPLIIGLSLAFLAIFMKIQAIVFSHSSEIKTHNFSFKHVSNWPILLHLGLVTLAGLWVPLFLLMPVIMFFMGKI